MARRTAQGLSKKEIIRCLKRYVVRDIYRALPMGAPEASSPTIDNRLERAA